MHSDPSPCQVIGHLDGEIVRWAAQQRAQILGMGLGVVGEDTVRTTELDDAEDLPIVRYRLRSS